MSGDLFTCVTCNVAFNDPELQRAHYKIDWHRYNLKRRVADLPAVSAKDFDERVVLQNNQLESSKGKPAEELFCKLCSKPFTTSNAFLNHKQSRKHRDLEAAFGYIGGVDVGEMVNDEEMAPVKPTEELVVKSDRAEKKAAQLKELFNKQMEKEEAIVEMKPGEEQEWEDIAEGEDDDYDESNAIDVKKCFFCEHISGTVEEKCEHMALSHGFFIPDMDHISDLEGLMKHLGVKLGAYFVCLWCSNKCYADLLSVQKHMIDKGHQKMLFEGETLLEYADFYDYENDVEVDSNASYDMLNDSDLTVSGGRLWKEDEISQSMASSVFESEQFQLVLPSGATIGHRSLFKYYKQTFGHRCLELKQSYNVTLKDKYRSIASNTNTYSQGEIVKQRKDLAYFKRWSARMDTKLGWKANKLQPHYRRQNICF